MLILTKLDEKNLKRRVKVALRISLCGSSDFTCKDLKADWKWGRSFINKFLSYLYIRSSAEKLLDKDNHFSFFNCAWTIFIKGSKHLIKSFIGELITTWEVSKSIFDEFLCFFFIKSTRIIYIISGPNLLNNTLNSLFFGSWHLNNL